MAKKETPTISLRGIRKLHRIGGETLAPRDGIDLVLGPLVFAAPTWPWGSGKSTFMNLLVCSHRAAVCSSTLDAMYVARIGC